MKKIYLIIVLLAIIGCGSTKKNTTAETSKPQLQLPVFSADSAYAFCAAQCSFGPRTMNSEAHDLCEEWIAGKFQQYGLEVVRQKAALKLFDGTPVNATNIIASYKPQLDNRILLCAHWDTRPWADNDPDSANWRKPVLGANDGASGVAVLIELARLITASDSLNIGIDFICFDAEDSGIPQWSDHYDEGNSWALGSQYWALNPHKQDYKARFGILLDMVGGQGAKFYKEGFSVDYASAVVDKIWSAAHGIGYGSYFQMAPVGYITDDHVAINQDAHIPTVDIVPYIADCPSSSFGPTWHTVFDDMNHIDRNTLEAVGQTVVAVVYGED